MRLSNALFHDAGNISITVKNAGGVESMPMLLRVARPNDPVINLISPDEVPGPHGTFTLKVFGKNFRASSFVCVGEDPKNTVWVSDTKLTAQVDAETKFKVGELRVRVKDMNVSDLFSNEKTLTVFGPRIDRLVPSVDTIVAGGGTFILRIVGQNFRYPATVEINGDVVPPELVSRPSRELIKVVVRPRFFQDAAKFAVVVKNPDGSASKEQELAALPPAITAFDPGELVAGDSKVRMRISGSNFMKRAKVVFSVREGSTFEVGEDKIRFRSRSLIVLSLSDQLSQLMNDTGKLTVRVVNPNKGDGVPSAIKDLKVSGPVIAQALIRPVKAEPSFSRLIITGSNFRPGATIEFVIGKEVQWRQSPDSTRMGRVIAEMSNKRLKALETSLVRVVNPGGFESEPVKPIE